MQLECQECGKGLNLPDDKVPIGRQFSFTCPYCKVKNTAIIERDDLSDDGERHELFSEQGASPAAESTGGDPAGDESFEAPSPPPQHQPVPSPPGAFGGVSQAGEFGGNDHGYGVAFWGSGLDDLPKAMVVYDDEETAELLSQKLTNIGYAPSVALNMRDAAKHLKFADFSLLLIQEDYFGTTLHGNHLLRSIQNLEIVSRRNMLVVLISPTMPTLDDLLAFSLSFDAVINASELDSIDRLLLSIIARGKKFYSVYNEVLAEFGLD